jgi:hypothetical protein
MKKGFLVLLTICFVIGVGATFAYPLEVDLTCPVAKRAGKLLTVTMDLENWECNPVSFSRTLVGLVGNSNDSLGGAGFWGPYNRKWAKGTVLAASCPSGFPVSPGTLTMNVPVISSVPASLVGTMAMVTVLIDLDDDEEGDACMVEVVAP